MTRPLTLLLLLTTAACSPTCFESDSAPCQAPAPMPAPTLAPNPTPAPTSAATSRAPTSVTPTCRYSTASTDGCANAPGGANPLYPALLSSYKMRPQFNVPMIDYAVGVLSATLKDPAKPPTGCSWEASTSFMRCDSSNAVVDGYDFTLHGGSRLYTTGDNPIVRNSKFSIAPNCYDPSVDLRNLATAATVTNNRFEGGGSTCKNLQFGTLINVIATGPATFTQTYNYFHATPTDVVEIRGPAAGPGMVVEYHYNFIDLQGYVSHPDGIQTNGGNIAAVRVTYNGYYNPYGRNSVAGTQPFHIEAQLTSAITNGLVAFNTIVTPGTCAGGGNWPTGCSVNTHYACKNDKVKDWVDSNDGFKAYGNYSDASGAIAAYSKAGGCTNTTWGSPYPNIDMNTGGRL
jgi:hypothetical protein